MTLQINNTYSRSILILLSCSLPILLISGPLLPDLVFSFFSIFFLYKLYALRKISKNIILYFLFFLTFNIILIISAINSEYFLEIYKSSVFYFRFFTFSLMLALLIKHFPKILIYTFYMLLFVYLVIAVDGYVEYLTGLNISGNTSPYPGRIIGFFDELIIGSFLARLLPLFCGLYVLNSKNIHKIFKVSFFITFFLTLGIIYLSGERTAFALSILFLLYILILLQISVRKKLYLIVFCFVVFFSLFLFFQKDYLNNKISDRMIVNPIQNVNNIENIVIFSNQHTEMIKTSLRIFLDHKIIGAGPNSFRYICKKENYYKNEYSCNTHTHNFYIQLISETGIIGFGFVSFVYISLILYIFYFRFIKNNLSNIKILFFGTILIHLFPFVPSGNFFNNFNNMIFYYPLSFLIWIFIKD